MSFPQQVIFADLGLMGYQQAWDLQEYLLQGNVSAKIKARNLLSAPTPWNEDGPDSETHTRHYLLFVEHPPVYTLGKSGHMENLLVSESELKAKGVEFYRTNRGGDITFHGPEQIVGYPILDLEKYYTDIGHYLRNLEQVIILTMADYGLRGERSAGETGVWLEPGSSAVARKICAIGVRCSRWVTMHGFAFNINTPLEFFDLIVPCGIKNKQVTSLGKELGKTMDLENVKEKLKRNFESVFNCRLQPSDGLWG